MRSIGLYHRHRFPAEIISHCIWLYFRFPLSFRDVEETLAMRGVALSYETIREWCLKFGQTYANDLRRRSPRPGDKWHLDEVFLIRSTDAFIIYGEPLTRMATFWIFARQRRDFARKSKAEMIPAEVFAAAMRDDGKETADALVWVILYSDPSIRTTWQLHTLTSDWG
jgi:hypothetical protein